MLRVARATYLLTPSIPSQSFLHSLPGDAKPSSTFQDFYKEDHPWAVEAKSRMDAPKNEAIIVPTQVNYVGSGGRVYSAGESMPGSASVVARHLRTGYLWDTVRVIGGAYGGFCTLGGKAQRCSATYEALTRCF